MAARSIVTRAATGLVALTLLVCVPSIAAAQSSSELLQTAQQLFAAEEFDRAADAFHDAIRAAADANRASDEAEAHAGLGFVLYEKARYAEARRELEQALGTFDALGARRAIARAYRGLGSVERATGDQKRAAEWYQRALSIAREDSLEEEEARTLNAMAFLSDGAREEDRQEMIARALELSRKLGLRSLEGTLLHQSGDRFFVTG